MGAEQSVDLEGKGGLATEILKLKAAKSGGWLSEEEFDTEVKRLIREHNGEAREPAYAFNDVADIIGDEVQMAEWEARYGDAAARDQAGHRPPPLAVEQAGSVELDLTGGVAAPSTVNALLQEIEAEGGAPIADLSDMQGGHERGQGDGGVEIGSSQQQVAGLALNRGGETVASGEEAQMTVEDGDGAPANHAAPTTPKAQQVPTSDEI